MHVNITNSETKIKTVQLSVEDNELDITLGGKSYQPYV